MDVTMRVLGYAGQHSMYMRINLDSYRQYFFWRRKYSSSRWTLIMFRPCYQIIYPPHFLNIQLQNSYKYWRFEKISIYQIKRLISCYLYLLVKRIYFYLFNIIMFFSYGMYVFFLNFSETAGNRNVIITLILSISDS